MNTEAELLKAEQELEANGWLYRGNGEWQDVVTSLTYPTSVAYGIMNQRK